MEQLRFINERNFMKIAIAVFMLFLSACSLEAGISKLISDSEIDEVKPVVLQSKNSNKEITPGSQQRVVTSVGYTVQSSVSYYGSKLETVTPSGYKVRTNVQATLFKE